MQILEEINTFQTQLEDVTKGVNRIRYLKQKISNSFGIIKGVGGLEDDGGFFGKQFSPFTGRIQTQCGKRKKNVVTLQTQRQIKNSVNRLKDNSNTKDSHMLHMDDTIKNSITRQKWNDSFNFPSTQRKPPNTLFKHQKPSTPNNTKQQTFYFNSLIKNIDPNSTDTNNLTHSQQQMSLQQLKKINYDSIKRQKDQMKRKIIQEKENRNLQILKLKEKVVLQQKLGKKKTEGFMMEKLEDLRTKRRLEQETKAKELKQQIKHQLELENKETERLKKFQNSIFLKQNIKKIIQTKLKNSQKIDSIMQQPQIVDYNEDNFTDFHQANVENVQNEETATNPAYQQDLPHS